jgi:hypothetical protein
MAHIRLDGMDLADIAKRLQMKCKIGPARGDADPPASPRQGAHHMASNKTRTAEHRHKPVCFYEFLRHVAGPRVQGLNARVVLERFRTRWNRESALALNFAARVVVCNEAWHAGQSPLCIDKTEDRPVSGTKAQVAEMVDALVSGTSGEGRGGSSPLLGTKLLFAIKPYERLGDDVRRKLIFEKCETVA